MRPKAWWPILPQSVSEKYVRKVRTAGVERHYAITAWGLNVALRRVRNDEPIEAALLHQPAFLLCSAGMTSAIRNGPRMV